MKSPFDLLHVAAFALLVGCSCGPDGNDLSATSDVVRTEVQSFITSGTPVTIASLGIEGMSCEMMCGGVIKKALEGTDGVISAEIQFDAEKDIDVAVVKYQSEKVKDAALISVVNELRDGLYKVRSVEVQTQVKEQADASEKDASGEVTALVPSKVKLLSLVDFVFSIVDLR